MVEQAEVLEHDADAAAESSERPPRREVGHILAENEDQPRVGLSDMKSSRKSVVLPAPDGPVRK